MAADVSIIICTRDRPVSLAETLAAVRRCEVPADLGVELIVVDNGRGEADEVIRAAAAEHGNVAGCFPIRPLQQATPGKSRSLNLALGEAEGRVLLFTDDDVRPPKDWIERMVRPILSNDADAVAGGVRLAASLARPWITAAQRSWLASTEDLPRDADHPLIGANMAVARRVFKRVPGFDEKVGPGAIGHAEDTLFWLQVREAGFRVMTRLDVEVEHHLDESRLLRPAFERLADKRGEFAAYVEYHWEHFERRRPRLAWLKALAVLWTARLVHPWSLLTSPTMPAWELPLLDKERARYHLLRMRRQPRRYECHGLTPSATPNTASQA